jgi:FkbM family methyltransferase
MLSKFISYAQNFEDVMLWRALKNYPPGNYVDVGAHDPVHFSVTKAFYERGWRGINIDAVPELLGRLNKDRPEDSNHSHFVGAGGNTIDFFQIGDTGFSTYSEDYAERHQRAGHEISKIQVEVRTLTSILEESGFTNEQFHFLKIDVEGAEKDVLLGLDLERFRPWVAVVEATGPLSTKLSLAFEPILLAQRYQCVYFDGLNRFYVAEERSDLIQAFQSPPCVFDDFDLWETVQAREANLAAEASGSAALDDVRKLITSKDHLIESKDSIILSKDSTILSKDALIASKDSFIAYQDSLISSQVSILASKDAHIHSSHMALIHFEHRASSLHSTFTKEAERAGKGLSSAYKTLYSSALWKRGAWIARLFRSKSPRSTLSKAATSVKESNSRHCQALRGLCNDMSRTIQGFVPPPAIRNRLGRSAAAITDLIKAGYSINSFKQ